jgi:hypothetical protein
MAVPQFEPTTLSEWQSVFDEAYEEVLLLFHDNILRLFLGSEEVRLLRSFCAYLGLLMIWQCHCYSKHVCLSCAEGGVDVSWAQRWEAVRCQHCALRKTLPLTPD